MNFKRTHSHILLAVLLALSVLGVPLLPLFGNVAYATEAGGTTMIYMNPQNPSVGDTVTITVQGSATDTITVSYSSTYLTLQNVDTQYTASGNQVTFSGTNAVLTFQAIDAGNGYVSVTAANLAGSSAAVPIGGGSDSDSDDSDNADDNTDVSDTSDNTSADESENGDDADAADNGANAQKPIDGDFEINGIVYVISERYTDEEIPAGFERAEVTVHGSDTYNEVTNGSMTLLYLKPSDNTADPGEFYLYDAASDSVSPLYLVGSMRHYAILQTPDMLPTLLMTESTFRLGGDDGKDVPCYVIEGMAEDGFVFFYGVNENQEANWYQYDTKEETLQRANLDVLQTLHAEDETETPAPAEETDEDVFSKISDWVKGHRTLIAVVIFLVVLLIIIIINIRVFRDKSEADNWEFDEADADGEEDAKAKDVADVSPEDAEVSFEGADALAAEPVGADTAQESAAGSPDDTAGESLLATAHPVYPDDTVVISERDMEDIEKALEASVAGGAAETAAKTEEMKLDELLSKATAGADDATEDDAANGGDADAARSDAADAGSADAGGSDAANADNAGATETGGTATGTTETGAVEKTGAPNGNPAGATTTDGDAVATPEEPEETPAPKPEITEIPELTIMDFNNL